MELRPTRVLAVTATAVLTAVVIAACGGGSSTPSATSAGTSTVPAGTGGPDSAAFTARRAQLAACLQKYGVTLPARSFTGPRFGVTGSTGAFRRFGATGSTGVAGAGARRRRFFGATGGPAAPGGGFGPGGAGALARNPKFAVAVAKCGGLSGGFGARFGATGATGAQGFANTSTAAYRASIVSYVACMKTNGVTLPKPNFTGVGFVFGTKVNRTTSGFVAANAKCEGLVAPAPAG